MNETDHASQKIKYGELPMITKNPERALDEFVDANHFCGKCAYFSKLLIGGRCRNWEVTDNGSRLVELDIDEPGCICWDPNKDLAPTMDLLINEWYDSVDWEEIRLQQ